MAWLSRYGSALREAIKRFVEVAFKSQDSLFTPGSGIWSHKFRADLSARYGLKPVRGTPTKKQLEGAPGETIQLAAELLFVQLLTPNHGAIRFAGKVSLVETVLGWSAEHACIPENLKAGLDGGMSSDMAFLIWRPYHLAFILTTLRAWWDDDLDSAQRDKLLRDPWGFKQFLARIQVSGASAMREILCFFVHPSHFEAITSVDKKKEFAREFGKLLESPTGDFDKDLLAIRKELSKTFGEDFSFFDKEIRDGQTANEGGEDAKPENLEAPMKALLKHLRQIIVYGPPGTGKTREAKRVALTLLTESDSTADAGATDDEIEEQLKEFRGAGRFDLVVFHPAYEYEQFVGGIEPTVIGQQLSFKAKAGVFTRLCRKAENDNEPAVLIIDEINRGNLPKLLGELVYALEYRGHEVRLPFDDGRSDLIVPKNLYVIATMNSADRSIGHIDVAIRRRFGLYPLGANAEVVKQVWSSAGNKDYGQQLANLMNRLNEKLGSGHDPSGAVELGVGHSYFLPAPGSSGETAKKQVQLKWVYQVQPLLREYAQLLNLGADSLQEFFNPLDQCLPKP